MKDIEILNLKNEQSKLDIELKNIILKNQNTITEL